ncbi:MAG: type I restriction enzyme HsdR N-terminal domain-containing protein [Bacteroidales bacterium]|jgi:hypothetical protein|nr:type I restriction enzyme HsdR N-terminal domain-containing protein [Bacteroidales bacterium]
MQKLNLPDYCFRTRVESEKTFIFDALRKKWVTLTPEEWVRQNFIRFLVEECEYPQGTIGTEVGIKVGGRMLRVDGVVYDRFADVKLLLEFKAPTVPINEKVFAQSADYNTKIGAEYIVISNGISHYCAHITQDGIKLLEEIPNYKEL